MTKDHYTSTIQLVNTENKTIDQKEDVFILGKGTTSNYLPRAPELLVVSHSLVIKEIGFYDKKGVLTKIAIPGPITRLSFDEASKTDSNFVFPVKSVYNFHVSVLKDEFCSLLENPDGLGGSDYLSHSLGALVYIDRCVFKITGWRLMENSTTAVSYSLDLVGAVQVHFEEYATTYPLVMITVGQERV